MSPSRQVVCLKGKMHICVMESLEAGQEDTDREEGELTHRLRQELECEVSLSDGDFTFRS